MAVGPDWRFVVTELGPPFGNGGVVTYLDRYARSREILYTLDAGAVARCEVPSDSPEINRAHTDGDPFLSYNNRLLYGFRRENQPNGSPWVCRFAGEIMQLEDEAQADQATTHVSAFDPWQLLMTRPITHNQANDYRLVANEVHFNEVGQTPVTLDQIALRYLKNTHEAHGTCRIDFGQTGFYTPHIETCSAPPHAISQGISVGEMWTQLCDTGEIDIRLRPIYDPVNRPGMLAELFIYVSSATPRYSAIFAWDRPGRSLSGVNHLLDGTMMANKVLFYRAGGQPVALQTATDSITKYGQYWLQKSVGQAGKRTVELWALAEMLVRKRGLETLTIDAIPERSPVPFLEYNTGDLVPVYASDKLRQPILSDPSNPLSYPGLWRVYALPIAIRDDGVETVTKIVLTNPQQQ